MNNITKLTLLAMVGMVSCTGCVGKLLDRAGLEHDTYPEEILEWAIEQGTGLSGDLTPESEED